MRKLEKQARAEARIGQPLAVYFGQSTNKHAPLSKIANDLDVSLVTAKIWTYQFNLNNCRLLFGPIITALYVLILAGVTVGGYLMFYWFNPY